jgi:hypothetical protein
MKKVLLDGSAVTARTVALCWFMMDQTPDRRGAGSSSESAEAFSQRLLG